ncbi:hypothetical protein MBH78_03410 [Oceanimonas sp. NS1]|nr:hypothetical protein [Oceanimonas sp. NS1]
MATGPGVRLWSLFKWGALALVLAWAWQGAEMDPAVLVRDAGNMAELASGFFHRTSPTGSYT